MSNLEDIREKKTPIVTLSGETRHLFYDLNAFAELEEIYGSVEKAMQVLGRGSVKGIINILWAGLINEDESLTQKAVGKMFNLSQITDIGKTINEAIKLAVPGDENSPKKEQSQTQEN